jgi:drug/metabolite transporter (DMT)-like permease
MRRLAVWQLFALAVLIWGTTWHVITWQLDLLSSEWNVALRFLLAGALVLAIAAGRGDSIAASGAQHALLVLQGAFMYGFAYVAVYQAERLVPSGLVAVGYSASPLLAGLGAHWLFGRRVDGRFVAGGVLGLAGVALIFWPEIAPAGAGETSTADAATGALWTVAAVLLSTVGALAASRNAARGLAMWPALGWGMVYGGITAAVCAVAMDRSFSVPVEPRWWFALGWLALAGSIVAFACFLTLQERIGPGPAGAVGVMTPLVALVVSMALENFRPDLRTGLGAMLAVAGNLLLLRRRRVLPDVNSERRTSVPSASRAAE